MPNLKASAYSSHSLSVNDLILILVVMRPLRPPWFLISLFMIHEVAEPHTMSRISFLPDAQPFQKFSRAAMKPEWRVSIQGISSIKITFLEEQSSLIRSLSWSKASIHVLGNATFLPAFLSEDCQALSCFFIGEFASPACSNVNV